MRALTLLCLLLAVTALGAPKKKKSSKAAAPPPSNLVIEAAVKKALDGAQEQVGACVVEAGGAGAWTQIVTVGVSINSAGQVLALDVKLKPENDKAASTKACIDKALKAIAFPKSESPMVQAEREWTFSMQ